MSAHAGTQQPRWLRPDIQGLRAIAVLLVVSFHAGVPIPGGFIGVDVFFVISGFVITGLIMRHHASPSGFRLTTFYARRMRRLLPALALMTSAVLVLAIFLESPFGPQRTTALTALGASFFVANFAIYANTGGYFDAPAELNPLLHTWSLSVEEQFYFVFPALMIFAWWWAARLGVSARVRAMLILVVIAVASLTLALALGYGWWEIPGIGNGVSWAFYSSATRAWEFIAGALVALFLAHRPHTVTNRLGMGLSVFGVIALGASAFLITDAMIFPGAVALAPVIATAALLASGTAPSPPRVNRALGTAALVWIGALSYSWYLWHWPVIVFTRELAPDNATVLLVAGLASLLPAWLAYKFVENPIRMSSRVRGRRTLIVISASMLIPSALALIVYEGAQRAWNSPAITSMAQQIQPVPVSFMRGCDIGVPLGQQQGLECTWNPESAGKPVYLVGDSQAGQFAEATISATEQLGRPLTIATSGSCPLITTLAAEEPLSSPDCESFVNQSIAWLREQEPATILIGMSGNYVTEEFEARLTTRLIRSIDALRERGHQIILFQAIPQFPEWSPYSCSVVDVLLEPQGCGVAVGRSAMDHRQAPAIRLFENAAKNTGAEIINVRNDLCTEQACTTNVGDQWAYRDPFHVTVEKSSELAPMVQAALTAK